MSINIELTKDEMKQLSDLAASFIIKKLFPETVKAPLKQVIVANPPFPVPKKPVAKKPQGVSKVFKVWLDEQVNPELEAFKVAFPTYKESTLRTQLFLYKKHHPKV